MSKNRKKREQIAFGAHLERIGCSMVALGGFGERFGRVLGGFWLGFGWILGGFLNFWARFCIDFLELSACVRE